MVERRIARKLDTVAARLRRLRFGSSLALTLLLLAVAGTLVALSRAHYGWSVSGSATFLMMGGIAALVGCLIYSIWLTRDYHSVARRVEARYPDLDARLLTAMEQQPEPEQGLNYLQELVIHETLRHEFVRGWQSVVPLWRIVAAYSAGVLAAVYWLMIVVWLAKAPQSAVASSSSWEALPPGEKYIVSVEPGNAEIERGTRLLVTARFAGPAPLEANLWHQREDGVEETLKMRESLDDPLFGASITEVNAPLNYRIEYAGQQTDEFHVTVFDYPALNRLDAELVFPGYTHLVPKQLADVRRITALEQTQLTIICHINKPLSDARLIPKSGGAELPLTVDANNPQQYRATWTLEHSDRYQVQLTDAQGRHNKDPLPEFTVTVTSNRSPDLKWAAPGRDANVSPLEEMQLAGSVWDDFGIVRYGVNYQIAGQDSQDVELGVKTSAQERHNFQHLLELESMKAEPDQLVSYHLWAEDFGPDGQTRRTFSDMYFAEVRHFDEIFRQGQEQPGGQQPSGAAGGGNQQQAEQMAELQKQIINGTWKVIRRETGKQPSDKFEPDVTTLKESQEKALEQLQELSQQLQDPQSAVHAAEANKFMEQAVAELTDALKPAVNALPSALSAEQAAYQSLLRLRAREHEVVRANQSSSSGSSGGSGVSQQQLNQLELNDSPNRYETERLAEEAQDPAQREMRQALNRLRELARRQGDVDERLKELQSALQQAQTPEERRELERQLKRLREEQEEILRDTEELQERMEREENLERMAEEREQLAQTRENVRRASEALEEGRTSQAIAAGTRAQREFEDLHDDLRRKTSSQFADEMREMRDDARELSNDQQQLVQQLDQLTQQESRSLRGSSERETTQKALEQQNEQLGNLLDQMKDTIEQADESEPLLSKRLYDSFRQVTQDNVEQALEQASTWFEQGIPEQAQEPARQAQQGIDRLAEGVERAAESILGDEAEALRRAQQELDKLTEQLANEIDRAAPQDPNERDAQNGAQQSGERAATRPGRADQARAEESGAEPGNAESGNAESGNESDPMQASENSASSQENSQQNGATGSSRSQQENRDQENQSRSGGSPSGGPRPPGDSPMSDASGQPQPSDGSQQPMSPPSPSSNPGAAQQPGSNNPGEGSENPASDSTGESPANTDSERQQTSQPGRLREGALGGGGLEELLNGVGPGGSPLTGDEYLRWSDRLRDVEEMLDDPELRAEAARIRDRARAVRTEFKRHSELPSWDLVRDQIQKPLVELRKRVAEELRQREGKNDLAPVDRDPVPPEYQQQVQRYYERIGSGR